MPTTSKQKSRSLYLVLVMFVLVFFMIEMASKKTLLMADFTGMVGNFSPKGHWNKDLSYVEIISHDDLLLATMAAAAPCEKTVVLDSPVELIARSSMQHNITDDDDDIVCIQRGNFVGAAFYMGSVVRTSTFSAFEDFLVSSSDTFYHIVERREVFMHGRYLPINKENNAIRKKDGNKGNFVWQYGATNLVNPYTTKFVMEKKYNTSAFIMATANLFLMNKKSPSGEQMMSNMAQHFTNLVTQIDLPSIILGLGVQVEFDGVENISTMTMDDYDAYKILLYETESRQKSKSIAVRGDITEKICENSGYTHCLSMGCPSLTISRNMNLGGVLEDKWNKVVQKLKKGGRERNSLKVALALPALQMTDEDYGPALDLLMSIFAQHDCYFILQSNYDRPQLNKYTNDSIDKSKILEFDDHVEPWFDFMKKSVDFVVSYRIHGAMAAISNEVPAIVIPTDFRILELVNAMKLPILPMENTKTKKYTSILDIIDDVSVNFDDFEQNRRDKLKQYKRILLDVGLEIDPALNAILTQ